ncbi:MAG: hypothetical protein RLZZ379_1492, partial [Pseudomonadota bacterium]
MLDRKSDFARLAFTAIDQEFKKIDILVNCAGVREVQKIY